MLLLGCELTWLLLVPRSFQFLGLVDVIVPFKTGIFMLYEEKYIIYSVIYLWLNLPLKWPPHVGACVWEDAPVWPWCTCFLGGESETSWDYFQLLKTLFLGLASPYKRHAICILMMIKWAAIWLRLLRFRELVPSSPVLHLGQLWH